jgi:ribose transport system permease protein
MRRLLGDYGMVFVLLVLCILFSVMTLRERRATGSAAVREVADSVTALLTPSELVVVVASSRPEAAEMSSALSEELKSRSFDRVIGVSGNAGDLRSVLDGLRDKGAKPGALAVLGKAEDWLVWEDLPELYPAFRDVPQVKPVTRLRSDFLTITNLLAIVSRIVVIAIIAIGMTMVIVTGGIDLSVGSLIALSGVVSTLAVYRMGAYDAPIWSIPVGFAAGIATCAVLGALTGGVIARFKVPPFITTLALMMAARGLAREISGDTSIHRLPDALRWLAQGRTGGLPNTVILLVVLYVAAHVFMTRTRLGRYIYAVGGNEEAARLSGVSVGRVIVFVYVVSAVMAGIGGVIQASQIKAGDPNVGKMDELYVIAAVVVGGTSLSGGSGKILGTLIGAFIISVIQNGMNLLGMKDARQMIVLGLVILGGVLLDRLRGASARTLLARKKTE